MKPLSAHMIEPRQTNTFSSELHHFWRQQVFSLVGKTKVVDLIFYVLSPLSIILEVYYRNFLAFSYLIRKGRDLFDLLPKSKNRQ